MEESKYWYRALLKVNSPLYTTLTVCFEEYAVIHDEDDLVVLGTQYRMGTGRTCEDAVATTSVVKSERRGPYYPTKKEAAVAGLVERLHKIEELDEERKALHEEYLLLLPYC